LKTSQKSLYDETGEPVGVVNLYSRKKPLDYQVHAEHSDGYSSRVTGSEFLDTVGSYPSTGTIATGNVILAVPVSPSMIPDSRLARIASTFSRYRFRSVTLELVPLRPSTEGGSIIMAFTDDPSRNYLGLGGVANMRTSMSAGHAASYQWFEHAVLEVRYDAHTTYEYVQTENGTEPRFEIAGMIYVVAASPIGSTGVEIYNSILHYDIEFADPSIIPYESVGNFGNTVSFSGSFAPTFGDLAQLVCASLTIDGVPLNTVANRASKAGIYACFSPTIGTNNWAGSGGDVQGQTDPNLLVSPAAGLFFIGIKADAANALVLTGPSLDDQCFWTNTLAGAASTIGWRAVRMTADE
jgi:hypothetical protein